MPKIPTIDSSVSIRTGSTGPGAHPSSFGGGRGLDALAAGIMNAGAGASSVGATLKSKKEREIAESKMFDLQSVSKNRAALEERKQQDNNAWLIEAVSQFTRDVSGFAQDSEKQASPTFPQEFDQYSQKALDEYLNSAPDPKVAQRFKSMVLPDMDRYFLQAQATAEKKRLASLEGKVESQVVNFLAEYRGNLDMMGSDGAASILTTRLSLVMAGIEDVFGEMPETKKNLESYVFEQAVLATAQDSPEFSKHILDEAGFEEKKRQSLESLIEQAQSSVRVANIEAFSASLEVMLNQAQSDVSLVDEVPLNVFESNYPDKTTALRAYNQFDRQRRAINFHNAAYTNIAGKNIQFMQSEYAKQKALVEKSNDPALWDGLSNLRESIKSLEEMASKDAAQYLMTHNDVVQRQANRVATQTDQQSRAGENHILLRLIRHYQGPPPEGASEEERSLYLNLPTQRRHVLTEDYAKEHVANFLAMPLGDKAKYIANFRDNFDGYEWTEGESSLMESWLFSDLVSLGEMPQAFQLAFMTADDPNLTRQVLESVQNVGELKKISPESYKDFEDALLENPDWQAFVSSNIGANNQRAKEVVGFKDGIIALATGLRSSSNPQSAIDQALDYTIRKEMGVIEVNGNAIAIPRKRGEGDPPRTDQDINDISIGLNSLLKSFPVGLIDPNDPRFITGGADNQTKQEIFRLVVANGGFWVPTQDGQSVTLYISPFEAGGSRLTDFAFELTDAQGNPFELSLDSYEVEEVRKPSPRFQRNALGEPLSMEESVRVINYNSFNRQGRFR